MPNGKRSRWIVVVQADRPELHPRLRQNFSGTPWVEVILDRRRGERRFRGRAPELDLRLADRRGTPGDQTRIASHRLAYQGDGFVVYEATSLMSTQCPECGVTVNFEMPRFGEPPARLDLKVVHEAVREKHARHVVEVQSFTLTGRPLLASRIVARTRADTL